MTVSGFRAMPHSPVQSHHFHISPGRFSSDTRLLGPNGELQKPFDAHSVLIAELFGTLFDEVQFGA